MNYFEALAFQLLIVMGMPHVRHALCITLLALLVGYAIAAYSQGLIVASGFAAGMFVGGVVGVVVVFNL